QDIDKTEMPLRQAAACRGLRGRWLAARAKGRELSCKGRGDKQHSHRAASAKRRGGGGDGDGVEPEATKSQAEEASCRRKRQLDRNRPEAGAEHGRRPPEGVAGCDGLAAG